MKKPVLSLDASLVQDDLPLEVAPKIFVGSIHAAFNLEALVANNITHILNASRLPASFPKQFTYLSVEIRDKDGSNILSCIPTTNIFIESGLDHGGVLVHCFGGKSRSPAFIAAYLMSSRNYSFDDAYKVIKTARPTAEINLGFEYQLRAYAAARFDVYVAQQLLLRARIRELHFLRGDSMVLNGDTNFNVAEHLTQSKLSVANLLGNQSSIQLRLEQIRQKDNKLTRNKRSFDEEEMDIDHTDEDSIRSPYKTPALMRYSPKEFLEDSLDSLGSGLSTDMSRPSSGNTSTSRRAKLMKERYSDDISSDTEKEKKPLPMTNLTFHTGAVGAESKAEKPKRRASRSSTAIEAKNPLCRLSRPGSTIVRVIPPLRGLEREFKCAWCSFPLFQLANVIRTDLELMKMLEDFIMNLQMCSRHFDNSSNEGKEDLEEVYLQSQKQNMHNMHEMLSPRNKQPLPPITSKHSGSTYVNMFNEPTVFTSTTTINTTAMEMEVDNDFFVAPPPLQTSRANKGRGFNFNTSDVAPLSLPSPRNNNNNGHNSNYALRSPRTILPALGYTAPFQNSVSNPTLSLLKPSPSPQLEPLLLQSNSLPVLQEGKQLQHTKSFFAALLPGLNPPVHGKAGLDISPRVVIPPINNIIRPAFRTKERPPSAEKRRWLARVNLLKEGDQKVAQLAEQDEVVASEFVCNEDKYFYVEYLDWMGKEVFHASKEYGDLCCSQCKKVVGCWNWTPSARMLHNNFLEAPLFLIHKHVVHHSDVDFDATPSGTPRLSEDFNSPS